MSWMAKEKEKRRLEKLYGTVGCRYFGGVCRNDKRKGHLERTYPYSTNHPNRKKWWRRHSNRRIRRTEAELLQRGQHKKCFDLWWTLY